MMPPDPETVLGDIDRSPIPDADIRTVFTAQQLLVISMLVVLFLLAPALASSYHLGGSGTLFIRLMLLAGLVTSLRTAPTIILERQLRYGQLSIIDAVEF